MSQDRETTRDRETQTTPGGATTERETTRETEKKPEPAPKPAS